MSEVNKTIPIEELVVKFPQSVNYLMNKGIKCIVCGEPIWGTLEDAAKERGFSDHDIERLVDELNQQLSPTL
ncbi:MAG: DUF1858 domain-containing protein [candidate division KSB1 bacterium]|nr:DUF1858 domain-containing protein [candidate division KSB1 bacterium]MDZ7336810.1 DUF1858 domain-containing protein [candidate division KSB1 bacterium]MDZ7356648.1 DUF1858 domain-containing protein [candidate division KSB1 bacterium]MDZ7398525.1 DUF1858 domain-containing protein [candidate division KSB1 bacterium]